MRASGELEGLSPVQNLLTSDMPLLAQSATDGLGGTKRQVLTELLTNGGYLGENALVNTR